ncbi:MAG: site-2 protease family protein [Candidatus Nezhaarchaeales archaeon]
MLTAHYTTKLQFTLVEALYKVSTMPKRELMELVISWLVISLCFSARGITELFSIPELFFMIFFASLISVGLGFLLHELMHRTIARRFGCFAEYRMWPWGLMLALILAFASKGSIIFAAPGAVYITPIALTSYISVKHVRRAYGLISLSGPVANLLLALIFYFTLKLPINWLIGFVAEMGFRVNVWLAAFNLIPVPPLDGFNVVKWNLMIWCLVAIPTWAIIILS